MVQNDRRAYPRKPVSWPVRLTVDESLILGRALDVSEYGLCVLLAPTAALKRGQSCRVEIVVDALEAFASSAEIRHVGDGTVGLQTSERVPLA
jgi:PilZ domain